jgi:hypothetical protein
MKSTDPSWLSFLDKLGIDTQRQTHAKTEEFLPEGFERSGERVHINVDDIPADLLPMTVYIPDGVAHLLKGEIIVHMNCGDIYHLSGSDGVRSFNPNIKTVLAKDKEQVIDKWLVQYGDKVVHHWLFARGGVLKFEVDGSDAIRGIHAAGLRSMLDKSRVMTFWEE